DITTSEGTRALTPNDVAVVAGDNLSVNGIAGFLSNLGLFPGITVGTADRLQVGQWHAVLAVVPLASAVTVPYHQLALRRLCVMAARHMTHLTWVHRSDWRELIDAQEIEDSATMIAVRDNLTSPGP